MGFQRSLIIQVCSKCPCLCPGCYNYFSDSEIESKALLQFISNFVNRFGITKITLSGGDPLLRTDIEIIVGEVSKLSIEIAMDTVGLQLIDDIPSNSAQSMLSKIKILGLPLDGSTTETIQLFREGLTLERSINVIHKAAELGANIGINTVVHAGNLKDIASILNIINKEESIAVWQLFQYMPIGPRGNAHNRYIITEQDFFQAINPIMVNKKRSNLTIQSKAAGYRKNKYLLVGSDGLLWYPKQTIDTLWTKIDENDERVILGKITDKDILDKVNDVVK